MDDTLKTMKPRSIKKTSPEQFELLRMEMTTHTAASLGYGSGRDRSIVDAEWKEIMEKLNAIGPPYRTLPEWKKVWSDVRLRSKKNICEEFQHKCKSESDEDILIDTLNNASSFYNSHNSSDQDFDSAAQPEDIRESSPDESFKSNKKAAAYKKQHVKRKENQRRRLEERNNRKKKTTPEQFRLLKQEMSKHPLAAKGYGTGKDRYKVDAEWKEILEKLYALGPPYRTLTEWKKVWSDVRLRIKKNLGKSKTHRRIKKELVSEDDFLMESLNDTSSIYASHNSEEGCYTVPATIATVEESATSAIDDNIMGQAYVMDERNPLDENDFQVNNDETTSHHNHDFTISEIAGDESQCNDKDPPEKDSLIEQTLIALKTQAEQHDKILQHLTHISTTMSNVMERQATALDRRNHILEHQSKTNDFYSFLQRRHELRRKGRSKISEWF